MAISIFSVAVVSMQLVSLHYTHRSSDFASMDLIRPFRLCNRIVDKLYEHVEAENTLLRTAGTLLPDYTASYSRRNSCWFCPYHRRHSQHHVII
jgi:hypothetical protein